MSEFPWPTVLVGDCCEVLDHRRVPLNAEERAQIPGDIPYYGANGVQGYISRHLFDEPLILLAEDGGYFDEYETRPIAYRISGKSWVNNHAHILRVMPGTERCQDFIFYALEHKNITPFIKGGTRAKLNQAELRAVEIPDPPPNLQQRIAEILSTVDEAIEQTEALIAKTQQIKAGLMHDLFTRGVTADGRLRPPREEAPQLYKESPLGWMPREWEVVTLREHSSSTANSFVNGPFGSDLLSSELRESGVPVLYVQDVKPDGFRKVSFAHVSENKADELAFCNVRQGDVLVAKVGTPPGAAAVYERSQRAIITQDVIRIRPSPDSTGGYVAGLLNSSVGSAAIRRIMIEGTRGRVSLTDFKKIPVPKPSPQEQQLVAARTTQVLVTIGSLESELSKLGQVKRALMQDLLTSRVPIKVETPPETEEVAANV